MTSTSRPLTGLQDFLTMVSIRPRIRDMPSIPEPLLSRARNCIRYSPENNDLLEFVGDRVLNFMGSLIAEKVKVSKGHHTAVRKWICNNDTFGRLASSLRLDESAKLTLADRDSIAQWNPLLSHSPPKVLADLFESYVGAIYVCHGWAKLWTWVRRLLEPLAKVATSDFCYSDLPLMPSGYFKSSSFVSESGQQRRLLDFLLFNRDHFMSRGQAALDTLPPATLFTFSDTGMLEAPDCERVEVANHLINLWVCRICLQLWPEYHRATARAAHLLSSISGLVVSDWSLAFLGLLLSMSEFICTPHVQSSPRNRNCKRPQLSTSFKATVGWFYYLDPDTANRWGEDWFRPVVLQAHDILVEDNRYRPCVPRSGHLELQSAAHGTAQDDTCPSKALGYNTQAVILDTEQASGGASTDDAVTALTDAIRSMGFECLEPCEKPASPEMKPKPSSVVSETQKKVIIIHTSESTLSSSPLLPPSSSTSVISAAPSMTTSVLSSPTPTLPSTSPSRSKITTGKWQPIGANTEGKENLVRQTDEHVASPSVNPRTPLSIANASHNIDASSRQAIPPISKPPTATSFIPRQLRKRPS